ncbi:hypothetical protein CSOJ01_05155 [Colletotrichum sojae]|uniref:Uncharacterized protein n=1 Tax=Colletotrichum sojae TaxID=2175907 RepID=A0A8H6MY28_9PEZI|nr:hypothetical protein CSOJ01_05155 [Colletotrichum sojae]
MVRAGPSTLAIHTSAAPNGAYSAQTPGRNHGLPQGCRTDAPMWFSAVFGLASHYVPAYTAPAKRNLFQSIRLPPASGGASTCLRPTLIRPDVRLGCFGLVGPHTSSSSESQVQAHG